MKTMTVIVAGVTSLAIQGVVSAQTDIREHGGNTTTMRGLGREIAAVGDVDADGVEDYVLAAPNANPTSLTAQAGSFWIRSGATGSLLAAKLGTLAFAQLGSAIDGAGDVDNDGFVDVVVGHVGAGGAVRVYTAKVGAPLVWEITGATLGGSTGYSLRGAGDVNNDGFPDVLTAVNDGSVRVLSGVGGAQLASFSGTPDTHFGAGLDGGVDLDGDGFRDVVVGSPFFAIGPDVRVGRVQAFSGATGQAMWQADGAMAYAEFGSEVSIGGDVDGDGVSDVAVQATYENDPSTIMASEGAVRVLRGSNGQQIWKYAGRQYQSMQFGEIDFSHDLDGDGITDVLAGYPSEFAGTTIRGVARVLRGADGVASSALVETHNLFPDTYGQAVASIGDLDGDAMPDFLVAFGTEDGATAGGAYVYGSVPSSGFAVNVGGADPAIGLGCLGNVGTQCDVAPPFPTPRLTAEGCFSPNGRAILYMSGGISNGNLVFLGAQAASIPLPGGCPLLVMPIVPAMVMPFEWPTYWVLKLPATAAPGTAWLQLVTQKTYLGFPNYNCLRVGTSSALAVTIQ